MKRACFLMVAAAFTTLGCQSQPGQFGSPFATGPSRVPPPVTGSIGTPIPQPSGAQYYPGGSAAIGAAPVTNPNIYSQATPSTSLGVQSVARANPPATTGAFSASAPAATPWQPAAVGNPTAQLFKTNAPANPVATTAPPGAVNGALQGTLGVNVNGNATVPPNANFNQPPAGNVQPNNWGQPSGWGPPANGYQVPVGNPAPPLLNGMPVNDATSAYPAPSPWSLAAWQNWWSQQQQQQQSYPQQQYQPVQQQQPWPAAGYATAAPMPGQLPVRGLQTTAPTAAVQTAPVAPASMQWGSVPNGEVQNPPVSPAVQQWGGLPMASVQPASFTPPTTTTSTTVRGNDGADASTASVAPVSASTDLSQASGRFANDPQYQWLRGQLEYSTIQNRWKLRYIPHDAPEGRIDSFGGSVVLTPGEKLSGFSSGAFVAVQGRLSQTEAGANDYAPIYQVESVSAQ